MATVIFGSEAEDAAARDGLPGALLAASETLPVAASDSPTATITALALT
jgi:hypothetical protein